jgi:lysophospholipase L1-like esterase
MMKPKAEIARHCCASRARWRWLWLAGAFCIGCSTAEGVGSSASTSTDVPAGRPIQSAARMDRAASAPPAFAESGAGASGAAGSAAGLGGNRSASMGAVEAGRGGIAAVRAGAVAERDSGGTGGMNAASGAGGASVAGSAPSAPLAGTRSEPHDPPSAFMPCPTTPGSACNVMPLGDSITEGCCRAPMGGYRIELFRQALANAKNITFVGSLSNGPSAVDGRPFPTKHEGHGGWRISQIAGIADKVISDSAPHIVLLKIGTNDINGNDEVTNASNRLASLIDQITKDAPAALVVVSAIIPTANDATNQRVQDYNSAIHDKATAAATTGKHVLFVDNYQAFASSANYKTALMADNLHPNDAGYAVLGKSFYQAIEGMLPAAP